jgi:hypothetical protein
MNTFKKLLTLYFGLQGKAKVEHRLISRYIDKVSPRLKTRLQAIEAEADLECTKLFQEAMVVPSLLEQVSKDIDIWGSACVVPVKFF